MTLALAISVLVVPLEQRQSLFIGALIVLLAQAALVFIRLLFFRRSYGATGDGEVLPGPDLEL